MKFLNSKLLRRIFVTFMVISILSLVACKNEKKPPHNSLGYDVSSNQSTVVGSDNSSGNGSSVDDTSSNDNGITSSSTVNVLGGSITASGIVSSVEYAPSLEKPTGYNEAMICNDKTGTPLVGGADTIAKEKRLSIVNSPNKTFATKSANNKTYYVSARGNNENDGLTPETAVKDWNYLTIRNGDVVLFERNSVFRLSSPFTTVSGVTYSAYGTGDKPAFYGSPYNYADKKMWKPSNMKNVWQVNFGSKDAGIVVFNHGENLGVRKGSGINQLKNNGDFYHNSAATTLYLYCDKGNPGVVYNDIELGTSTSILYIDEGVHDVVIDNLSFKYGSRHAISSIGNASNITVTNCEIGWIGGAPSGVTRLGNGIEFYNGIKTCNISNNWLYQIFDTAITFQGASETAEYTDVSFRNNLIEYCCCSFEFWGKPNNKVENFVIENNVSRFSGFGWGNRTSDAGFRGIEGHIYAHTGPDSCSGDITLKNNIFDLSNSRPINWYDVKGPNYKLTTEGNIYYDSAVREYPNDSFRFDGTDLGLYDQGSFEMAIKLFDKNAKLIKWLE